MVVKGDGSLLKADFARTRPVEGPFSQGLLPHKQVRLFSQGQIQPLSQILAAQPLILLTCAMAHQA